MFEFFRELPKNIQDLTAEVRLLRQVMLAKQQPAEQKTSASNLFPIQSRLQREYEWRPKTSTLKWLALSDPNYNGWKYKNLEQAILGACSKQCFSQISLLNIFQNQETTKVLEAIHKLKTLELLAKRHDGSKAYVATPLGIQALAWTIQEPVINSKTT